MLRWLIVALFVSSTFATEHLTRVARYGRGLQIVEKPELNSLLCRACCQPPD